MENDNNVAAQAPVLQTGAERLAQRIKELSDGRIEIEVYAGGEIVPPLETFQAVSDGTAVQCGSGAAYYWQARSRLPNGLQRFLSA